MPVRVRKSGNKWRVIEPSGKIAKSAKGNAKDGGGHATKASAQAQAAAINRGLALKGKI